MQKFDIDVSMFIHCKEVNFGGPETAIKIPGVGDISRIPDRTNVVAGKESIKSFGRGEGRESLGDPLSAYCAVSTSPPPQEPKQPHPPRIRQ
ncbi:hypothetical protein Zmor_005488 [Zophobas morio]|uniref:Uncharacterized protein n=1 Tax=Zophobas morio TaxID=2755281 RepID=A0AA38ITD7_9CUCU|nr:hypothetical protein Zmor_005488 [Zophobas morio]